LSVERSRSAATAEGGDIEAEGGEARGKEVGDGGSKAAQSEHGTERGVAADKGIGARGDGVGERGDRNGARGRRGEVRFVANLGEIGRRGEAGVANGFEALDLVTESTGEPAVDVERTAAHAGDGAHILDARVGELAEDEGLARTEGVADHAGYFDVKRLGLGAAKDGPNLAALAGPEFVERNGRRRRKSGLGGENAR
jgi:hypothetical protein